MKKRLSKMIESIKIFIKLKFNNKNKIILCNTPIHENLGDQAIALAELEFFKRYCKDYCVIELTEEICVSKIFEYLKTFFRPSDIIILQGGGFMGDLWPRHEVCMHRIIQLCLEQKIIIFPQTCYLTDTDEKEYFAFYKKYRDRVFFMAREKKTYELFLKNGIEKKHCFLVPDIVLSLDFEGNKKREGIGLCLRNDKESILDSEKRDTLYKMCENISKEVTITGTLNSSEVSRAKREKIVIKKFEEFSSYQLVITDRLHGMIFCAITGTPCITINNLSSKVSGVYEWIKDLQYIYNCQYDEITEEMIKKYILKKTSIRPINILEKEFDRMYISVLNILKNVNE